MIRTNYDPEADVLHVGFARVGAAYDNAHEVAPGIFVEFDKEGQPIGIEITSIRWRSEQAVELHTAAE